MRIVNRAAFLAMPAGTLYAKFGDTAGTTGHFYFDEARIKGDLRGENDWWSVGFTDGFTTAHDSNQWAEHLERAVAGESVELDFETLDSDGLYDDGQLFAVFEKADALAMLARLKDAMRDGYDQPSEPTAT